MHCVYYPYFDMHTCTHTFCPHYNMHIALICATRVQHSCYMYRHVWVNMHVSASLAENHLTHRSQSTTLLVLCVRTTSTDQAFTWCGHQHYSSHSPQHYMYVIYAPPWLLINGLLNKSASRPRLLPTPFKWYY